MNYEGGNAFCTLFWDSSMSIAVKVGVVKLGANGRGSCREGRAERL